MLCGLAMLCLGTYMYQGAQWKAEGVPAQATWFPVSSIFLFIAASTIGYLVVPWVMIGELYPSKVRKNYFTLLLLLKQLYLLYSHTSKFMISIQLKKFEHALSKNHKYLYLILQYTGFMCSVHFTNECKKSHST